MGVTHRWLTWMVGGGLALFFIGERVFHDSLAVRVPLSGLGALGLLVAIVLRVAAWRKAEGDARRIERLFALAYLGCAIALLGFFVGTEEGVRFLSLEFRESIWEVRFRRSTLAVSAIVLVISLLPTLAAQWAVRSSEGAPDDVLPVRTRRITETAAGALTVALAGTALMLLGYVASVYNQTLDASYFKTSRPGTSVQEIVRSFADPLETVLFFPDLNPVSEELATYFGELASITGNVQVEQYDRLSNPLVAEQLEIRDDGVLLLRSGGRTERLQFSTELNDARVRLRVLDGEIGEALLKLSRARGVAYMTVGHGELNDPDSRGISTPGAAESPSQVGALERYLGLLNYDNRDLGIQHGLADRVPDDAAMVLVLGPRRAFADAEIRALGEYLDRGGALLLALEPDSDFDLSPLASRLGLRYTQQTLADDRRHVRRQGGPADRRLIVTDRFSSHPAVTTASRQGVGAGILLMGSGYLSSTDDPDDPRPSFLMASLTSTFADENGNWTYDDEEARGTYELAAAVERELDGETTSRALVYADSELFSDAVLLNFGLNAAVIADGIRWLGDEEAYAGETTSEEDVPIVHTRSEDVAWFYAIILGAPAVVLLIGFLNGSLRRSRRRREGAR